MPLKAALDLFAQQTGANLSVDWRALESAGVTRKTPVSIFVREIPARRVLSTILDSVSGGTANLGYVVKADAVFIASRDILLARFRSVRAYPIGFAFADEDPDSSRAQAAAQRLLQHIQAAAGTGTWRDEGGLGWARVFGPWLAVEQGDEIQQEVADLVAELRGEHLSRIRIYDVRDLIIRNAAPDLARMNSLAAALKTTCGRGTWRDAGGTTSSLAFFDGKLCVNAHDAVHEQIAHQLALLRQQP